MKNSMPRVPGVMSAGLTLLVVMQTLAMFSCTGCDSHSSKNSGGDTNPNEPAVTSKRGEQQRPAQAKTAASRSSVETTAKTLPTGTMLTIQLGQTVSSRASKAGDTFEAFVVAPVEARGAIVIPPGSTIYGVVEGASYEANGRATLALKLTSVKVDGVDLPLNATLVGGEIGTAKIAPGGGLGGVIGGLTGAGSGASRPVTFLVDKKDIVVPAKARLTFELLDSTSRPN